MSDKPKTVKEFDAEDRPRERAIADGCSALSIPDLWAIILRTGTPGYPITELTRDMMRANNGRLRDLELRKRKELMKFRGMGITKAVQVEAVLELIRRYNSEELQQYFLIRNAADIDKFMRPALGNLDHEEIWIVLLNRRNQVIKSKQMSMGGRSASVFDVKIILKEALLENASGIILCHNHPSGNLKPSKEDDNITRLCREACRAVDINMLDHVILSVEGYYSYTDEGRL